MPAFRDYTHVCKTDESYESLKLGTVSVVDN